jgi:hypothetical protein
VRGQAALESVLKSYHRSMFSAVGSTTGITDVYHHVQSAERRKQPAFTHRGRGDLGCVEQGAGAGTSQCDQWMTLQMSAVSGAAAHSPGPQGAEGARGGSRDTCEPIMSRAARARLQSF